MKDVVFSYYNLEEDIIKKISEALGVKLIEYSIGIIPTVLFCDANEVLDELFLEYMFNNRVIVIRTSPNSNNPFVLTVNDEIVDTYQYSKSDREYQKQSLKNMNIFKDRVEKLLQLNVTPLFSDVPNSIDIIKNSNYMDLMSDYVEYLNMSEVGHSIRVAQYSKMLAQEVGYEKYDILYVAGILHDVGKTMVDNKVRLARRNLDDEEFAQMKKHTIYSCNLLNKSIYLPVRDIILYHHERCDGSGYPYGIRNIPLASKILAIADSYDAMTSSRIYTDFKSKEDAIGELKSCAEKGLYDKYLVDKFVEIITR